MSTVAQIIAQAERYISNSDSDANLIIDLNRIQLRLYSILRSYNKGIVPLKIDSAYTVADQLSYLLTDFSSYLKLENVVKVQVSEPDYGDITDTSNWITFQQAGVNDYIDIGDYWQEYLNNTKIALTRDGIPISSSDKQINIWHYPKPETLSQTSDTPEINSDYHDLLEYKLISMIAARKEDNELQNYWELEYKERLQEVIKDLSMKNSVIPDIQPQCEECW